MQGLPLGRGLTVSVTKYMYAVHAIGDVTAALGALADVASLKCRRLKCERRVERAKRTNTTT